jgi:hypothetical protein
VYGVVDGVIVAVDDEYGVVVTSVIDEELNRIFKWLFKTFVKCKHVRGSNILFF